jgi:hypothetical protein
MVMTSLSINAASVASARTCEHTGLDKPECHCPVCLRALIEKHRPAAATHN